MAQRVEEHTSQSKSADDLEHSKEAEEPAADPVEHPSPKPLQKDDSTLSKNAPYASRFPQEHQSNRCWSSYVQHKIAVKKFSENSREARKEKALYTILCPRSWVSILAFSLPLSFFS